MKNNDLTGKTFNRLTVLCLSDLPSSRTNPRKWICRCVCGANTLAGTRELKSGRKKSCGCLLRESSRERMRKMKTKHGACGEKLYNVWRSMKSRCHRETDLDYCYYGARGIAVCDRWRESYSAFKEDVGSGWKPGLTLDRIDNDGNYEPGNVKWSTMTEQALNRRPKGSVFPTRRNR